VGCNFYCCVFKPNWIPAWRR